MRKILTIAFLVLLVAYSLQAQQVRPAPSNKIYHQLSQLRNLTSVLYIAAHPDDENTRLLSWLVNERHISTAYLSLTRGDGGQNILGREQGAALGLIRTHELIEARKLDGAEQYFSRAVDFGFSKSADETFKHWNKELITGDVVWIMRQLRPDVVICRFPPDARAGHGQHAASAIIAHEAFKASGDKERYGRQLKSYQAWQPKRLLFNSFRFSSVNTTSESHFKIATGQYNPGLAMGYGELAGISRSIHRSQGAGTPSVPGIQTEYFELVDGEPMSASLFDGIDTTWNRIGRKDIDRAIEGILADFDFKRPDASVPALLRLRKQISGVNDSFWRSKKLNELDDIILSSIGFMAELYTNQPVTAAGNELHFVLNVLARSAGPVELVSVEWPDGRSQENAGLKSDVPYTKRKAITIPEDTGLSEPYWLSQAMKDAGHFTIPGDSLLGLPASPNALKAVLRVAIHGEKFQVSVPLSFKRLDPVRGDMVEGLRIVPDVSLGFTQTLLVADAEGSVHTSVRLRPNKALTNAVLSVRAGNNILSEVKGLNLSAGIDTVVSISIPPANVRLGGEGDFSLDAVLHAEGKAYHKTQHLIQYSHIPTLQYFTTSSAKVLRRNWSVSVKRIGYIEGAGDYVPDFLRLSGLSVDILKDTDLTNASYLSQYDAIITGIRAVNTEKRMRYWLPVLHRYVQEGGTLIMQYNTLQDMASNNLGPYPFSLGNLRVTEENAPVKLLQPQHRLLQHPNSIQAEDFNNWVQERGLYFPSVWNERYQPLFEMNDTGAEPLRGSTLYAPFGKGHYIYTSLSFFRQLPAGNQGAIKLLMNFLSVGK